MNPGKRQNAGLLSRAPKSGCHPERSEGSAVVFSPSPASPTPRWMKHWCPIHRASFARWVGDHIGQPSANPVLFLSSELRIVVNPGNYQRNNNDNRRSFTSFRMTGLDRAVASQVPKCEGPGAPMCVKKAGFRGFPCLGNPGRGNPDSRIPYFCPFFHSFINPSTSSACPSGFTFSKTCSSVWSGPIKNVVRAIPHTFLPYMFFSFITPN